MDTQSHALYLSLFITLSSLLKIFEPLYRALSFETFHALKSERKKLFAPNSLPILLNFPTSNVQKIADWPASPKHETHKNHGKKEFEDNKYIRRSNSIWLIECCFRNGSFATIFRSSKKKKEATNIKNILNLYLSMSIYHKNLDIMLYEKFQVFYARWIRIIKMIRVRRKSFYKLYWLTTILWTAVHIEVCTSI